MHDVEVKTTCPNCKRPMRTKMREMVPGTSRSCPHGCGASLRFSGDDGRKTQAALNDLERSIRRLGGR